jgi:hypothetical protein
MPLTLEAPIGQIAPTEKPKKIIDVSNRVYDPLAKIGASLNTYTRDSITKSCDAGLVRVVESNLQRPGQWVSHQHSTFVNGMLEKMFSVGGGLQALKDDISNPIVTPSSILEDGTKSKMKVKESPGKLVYNSIRTKMHEALKFDSPEVLYNCRILAEELSLPEITAILAAYLEKAELVTTKYNEFETSNYTRVIGDTTFEGIEVSDLTMRIRNTPSDLRGHEGGKGHLHLEISFTKKQNEQNIKPNQNPQKIAINIHIYPNLKPFSKAL